MTIVINFYKEIKEGKMIKIAICDDENSIVNEIERVLFTLCKREGIKIDIDAFYSGESLEDAIRQGENYDLLYLDIHMKGKNGIETAKNIRKMDENTLIIFVSGYEKYWMELFRLDVFTFVKKPIDQGAFEKIFLEAHQKICDKRFYFSFHFRNEEYKIPCNEIFYFESCSRQIVVHLKNHGKEIFNAKLSDVVIKLADGKVPFLRIHQSYLVNYHFIKTRSKTEVTLVDGTKLPISEERQKEFHRSYSKLLGGEINV